MRGLAPGDDDGTIESAMAIAAAETMTDRLRRAAEQARSLDELLEEADTEIEAASLVEGLLEAAMDAWAVYIAVSERAEAQIDGGDWPAALLASLDDLGDQIDSYDLILRDRADGLCLATASNILEFWRSTLGEPYSLAPPWWLDGALERRAEEMEREVLSWGPDEATRAQFRREVVPGLFPSFPATLPPADRPPLLAAAAAAADSSPDIVLDWVAPDQDLRARLRLPTAATDAPSLRLGAQFMSKDWERVATELAGRVASLAGLAATVDDAGRAYWDLAAIRAASRDLDLEVQGQLWIPISEDEP